MASTNTKDFYNLIHVYLDAVLHPRAIQDPKVLQQEGWHFELENAKEPLTFKGVVYNEMKGMRIFLSEKFISYDDIEQASIALLTLLWAEQPSSHCSRTTHMV